jgi:menaquinone-dependent protoporphyrinogen IX oxidase
MNNVSLYEKLWYRIDLTNNKIAIFSVRLHDATTKREKRQFQYVVKKLEKHRDLLEKLAFLASESERKQAI